MDQEHEIDSKITFYRNSVGMKEGKDNVYVYTESMEDWGKFKGELEELVLYKAIRAFFIGILIGMFTGFFTARADQPSAIKALIHQKAVDIDQAAALTAIAFIESSFNPKAKGSLGEVGLFQFLPTYFKLKDKRIETQVQTAINHYNFLTKHCPDVSIALAWNLGCNGAKKIKKPKEFAYYVKFKKYRAQFKNEFVGREALQLFDIRRRLASISST